MTEDDKQEAELEPAEFVNAGIDCVFDQKSDTVRTFAAQCLEVFVDKIDGLLTFVIDLILEMAQRVLT